MTGKINLADAPSCRLVNARELDGCCTATLLIARCITTFRFRQLYAITVQEDNIFENVPPDTIADLILEGLAEDHTAKGVCLALGLPRDYPAKVHSVTATLLCQDRSHWQQHDSFLHY
jgi:hypothetical protein